MALVTAFLFSKLSHLSMLEPGELYLRSNINMVIYWILLSSLDMSSSLDHLQDSSMVRTCCFTYYHKITVDFFFLLILLLGSIEFTDITLPACKTRLANF